MPTPAVAFLTRTLGVDAGIVISASHNPHYDNGIKFFSAGRELDDATELEAALDVPFTTVESELGKASRGRGGRPLHRVLQGQRAARVRPAWRTPGADCAHGAT